MREFEPDLLKALVAFADTGTLARTAKVVGRTPSAVTAQMQRLEEVAGTALLQPSGRGRMLTDAGERLVAHARAILAAHRQAWASLAAIEPEGRLGIGLTQDFTGAGLTDALGAFARARPRLQLALRVGRSGDLAAQFGAGEIDVMVAMREHVRPDEVATFALPMRWLAARTAALPTAHLPLPLALLDAPCGFRDATLRALEKAGRDYRIAATSATLEGVFAAVRAGIAVTVRTGSRPEEGIAEAPADLALPPLPRVEFSIRVRDGSGPLARNLAEDIARSLAAPPAS